MSRLWRPLFAGSWMNPRHGWNSAAVRAPMQRLILSEMQFSDEFLARMTVLNPGWRTTRLHKPCRHVSWIEADLDLKAGLRATIGPPPWVCVIYDIFRRSGYL